jgi:hypothetical protein
MTSVRADVQTAIRRHGKIKPERPVPLSERIVLAWISER